MTPISNLLIPIALLVILLPGLVWERYADRRGWFGAAVRADPPSRLIDLFGFGFALVAAAGMLTFFLPVRVNGSGLIFVILLLIGLGVRSLFQRDRTIDAEPVGDAPRFPWIFAALAFAGILAFRFYQAAELVLPAWVDSLHHTLLVRLVLENGGLPATFEPYMPVPLYYHTGFHTNAALFAALTGLSPDRAVLVFGQILNAAVALGVYRLGLSLWPDGRRAWIAMLLVGFCFQMPAYYLTWGRYTLLAGTFLLTLAMSAALDLVRGGPDAGRIVHLAVLTAGLLLTHYFSAALFLLFLGVVVLERLFARRGFFKTRSFRGLLVGAAAGGLFALPWVVRAVVYSTDLIGLDIVLPAESLDEAYFSGYRDYLLDLLGPRRGIPIPGLDAAVPGRGVLLHGLALAGLVLIGWRRGVRPLALFALAAGLLSLPWGVNLAPFRPDHGVILAFLPAALLAADALVSPLDAGWPVWTRRILKGLFAVAVFGILSWGMRDTIEIVNPTTVLADADDRAALEWIAENTPEEAVFLINATPWQGGAYRGVDGGWWITPLTGRKTSLPPVLYLDGELDYVLEVLDRAERMSGVEGCGDDLRSLLEETGATYVYLHQGKGTLQPAALGGCEGLRPVYADGEVFIFGVMNP